MILFQVQGGIERDWEMALASLVVVLHTVCCTRLSSSNGKTEGCSIPPACPRYAHGFLDGVDKGR